MGAKLAALAAQDGATDGQVGGTWEPKWGQHGKNHQSEDGSFFLMPHGIDIFGILMDFNKNVSLSINDYLIDEQVLSNSN